MKEPYRKGVAIHPGPESCAGGGNTTGEALTGGIAGQPLNSEIKYYSACRPCLFMGKATP
jgi:RNA-directed DNA polymerase